jgi:hypothetical protein
MPRNDDEDDEDRPRRRKRDDEDEDDGDRPRRRGKKKARAKAKSSRTMFVAIGGGLLALVAAVVVAVVLSKGRKDRGAADTKAPAADTKVPAADAGTAGGDGGGRTGGTAPAPPPPPPTGEMAEKIGEVAGLKPPILKPSAEYPGVAFRFAVREGYGVGNVVLPPQPSDFFALVFATQERFALPLATVVDRRTARPVGKVIDLLPEFRQVPRPPIGLSRPDVSADGTLLLTHKHSTNDKWAALPVQVWDVASGSKVKEIAVPAGTFWQGWASPDRLITVGTAARFNAWAYPAGARLGEESTAPTFPGEPYGTVMGPASQPGGTPWFAVTADRKRIALFRGARAAGGDRLVYSILDTASGRELGRLPQLQLQAFLPFIAFSPDGTKLAYMAEYETGPDTRVAGLFVADGITGAGRPPVPVKDVSARDGLPDEPLYWWGSALLVRSAGVGVYGVFDPETGRVLAKLGLPPGGKMLATAGDGRLWVKFDASPAKGSSAQYVCAFDPPPEVPTANGQTFLLTPDGIQPAAK